MMGRACHSAAKGLIKPHGMATAATWQTLSLLQQRPRYAALAAHPAALYQRPCKNLQRTRTGRSSRQENRMWLEQQHRSRQRRQWQQQRQQQQLLQLLNVLVLSNALLLLQPLQRALAPFWPRQRQPPPQSCWVSQRTLRWWRQQQRRWHCSMQRVRLTKYRKHEFLEDSVMRAMQRL